MKPEDHAEQPFFATMQRLFPDLHCAFQVLNGVLIEEPEIKAVLSNSALTFSEIEKGLEQLEFIDAWHLSLRLELLHILSETQEILTIKKTIIEEHQLGGEFIYSKLYPHHDRKKQNITTLISRCSKILLWISGDKVRNKWRAHASVVARRSRAVRSKKQQQEKKEFLAKGVACLKTGHPTHKRHWNDVSEVARHMALTQGYPERKMADLLRRYVRDLTAQEQSLLPLRRKSTQKKITPNA